MHIIDKTKPTFISLFCGCGGFDLGFIQAGFECIAAFDIDPLAVDVHNKNLTSKVIVHDLSIGCDTYGPFNNVDVIIAGPPCQGFSTAGKRNIDDPRNHLLVAAGIRAIKLKPKVFIAENVRGVVSGAHKKYWRSLEELLKEAGYDVVECLIDVSKLGLPQSRKRMVMIAWNTRSNFSIPLCAETPRSLKDVISGINKAANHNINLLDEKNEASKIAKHIRPSQKLCDVRGGPRSVHTWNIPEVFGHTTEIERTILEIVLKLRRQIRLRNFGDADPVTEQDITQVLGQRSHQVLSDLIKKGFIRKIGERYDLVHAFNGKYRRLSWDKPSPTVDTRFIEPRYFLHPDENRGFTVREAARIQGFPDSFIFSGTEKEQCRLIGNAVPPPLGKWLGDIIMEGIINEGKL